MSKPTIGAVILTAGPAGHTLDVSGFSGSATLNGGDVNDTFIVGANSRVPDMIDGGPGTTHLVANLSAATKDVSFVLQNHNMVIVQNPSAVPPDNTEIATLANIQTAAITGSPQNDSFDVSGWTAGNLAINGLAWHDIIIAQISSPGTVPLPISAITFPAGLAITLQSNVN